MVCAYESSAGRSDGAQSQLNSSIAGSTILMGRQIPVAYLELTRAKRRDIGLGLFHGGTLDFKVRDFKRGK